MQVSEMVESIGHYSLAKGSKATVDVQQSVSSSPPVMLYLVEAVDPLVLHKRFLQLVQRCKDFKLTDETVLGLYELFAPSCKEASFGSQATTTSQTSLQPCCLF